MFPCASINIGVFKHLMMKRFNQSFTCVLDLSLPSPVHGGKELLSHGRKGKEWRDNMHVRGDSNTLVFPRL
jgi:hypothetical protein